MFPYDFIHKYDSQEVEVHRDEESDYRYVIYNKKIILPPWLDFRKYKVLSFLSCLEQDNESPHSYASSSFIYNEDDIAVDASAAEGNFSLSIVDKVKKLYIFECSEGWIGPLQKTFEPWREKVEIIPLKLSKMLLPKVQPSINFSQKRMNYPRF